MARKIPNDFIQALLERVDIVDVVGASVALKKKGSNHLGLCPFHQEKTPSFTVSQAKQFYYCFGCGASGSAVRFLMENQHLEFVEAIEELAHSAGMDMPKLEQTNAQTPEHNRQRLLQLMNDASEFFQQQLAQSSERQIAVDYLKSRGIDGQTAARFQLGLALDQWRALKMAMQNKGYEESELIATGLVIKPEGKDSYDRFRDGRIMYPIADSRGRVIAFGSRVTQAEKQPKYLNSSDTALFNKGRVLYGYDRLCQLRSEPPTVLIVEGYMDVIALAQYDMPYAVASLGTAFSAEHFKLLLRQHRHITFCFDGDRAGIEASQKALLTALPFLTGETQVFFLSLPDNDDPDAYVRKHGKDRFEARLQQAKPLTEQMLENLSKGLNLNHLDGRARFLDKARPMLNKIPQGALRTLLLHELSTRCQVPLRQLMYSIKSPQATPRHMPIRRLDIIELTLSERALMLILQQPKLLADPELQSLNSDDEASSCFNQCLREPQMNTLNTAMILEAYHEHPMADFLSQLAAQPLALGPEAMRSELLGLVKCLNQQNEQSALEDLIKQSRQRTLSPEEKQAMLVLLRGGR